MKLCKRGKLEAQRRYKVYPSAYANAYAARICKKVRRSPASSELRRWFAERWVNVCEPPPFPSCGMRGARRGYPYCRPTRRISPKTPKTVGELSKAELKRRCKAKRRLQWGYHGRSPRRLSR